MDSVITMELEMTQVETTQIQSAETIKRTSRTLSVCSREWLIDT